MPLADRALIVGINRYPGIADLQGPENDANDFYAWVTSPAGGGVAPGNARRIRSSDFMPPPGDVRFEKPAQEEVNEFFTDIDVAAEANNQEGLGLRAGKRLWMFFSGHGFAPTFESSGVFMANATTKRTFNVAAVLWADRIVEGGWFDEVLLFQDACRNRMSAASLTDPFFAKRTATKPETRKRFYVFSSRDQKLSKEIPCDDGKVRGVFAVTLLEGLRGAARDPVSMAITARSLRTYLQDNMKSKLSDADKKNPDIAQAPDFRDPDLFDIVPAAAAGAVAPSIDRYPVLIRLPGANMKIVLQDGSFNPIQNFDPAPQEISVKLSRGLYQIAADGAGERVLKVTGPGAGAEGLIDVSFAALPQG